MLLFCSADYIPFWQLWDLHAFVSFAALLCYQFPNVNSTWCHTKKSAMLAWLMLPLLLVPAYSICSVADSNKPNAVLNREQKTLSSFYLKCSFVEGICQEWVLTTNWNKCLWVLKISVWLSNTENNKCMLECFWGGSFYSSRRFRMSV